MPKWKLHLDENESVVMEDGLPVFVNEDDESEKIAFNPNQMHSKILGLNKESKTRREENEQLRERLKVVEDIEDLAEFRARADEAMSTVTNLQDKDFMDAEKVEKLKNQMKSSYEEQQRKLKEQFVGREDELKAELSQKDAAIRKLMVSNKFATSPLFSGDNPKTTLPPDIAETYFGRYFEVRAEGENLQLIAKDDQGEPLYSRQRVGELADFDEAVEMIFNRYPGRDKLLRSTGGGSGGSGGDKTVKSQTPIGKLQQQMEAAQKNGDVTGMIRLRRQLHSAMQNQ